MLSVRQLDFVDGKYYMLKILRLMLMMIDHLMALLQVIAPR